MHRQSGLAPVAKGAEEHARAVQPHHRAMGQAAARHVADAEQQLHENMSALDELLGVEVLNGIIIGIALRSEGRKTAVAGLDVQQRPMAQQLLVENLDGFGAGHSRQAANAQPAVRRAIEHADHGQRGLGHAALLPDDERGIKPGRIFTQGTGHLPCHMAQEGRRMTDEPHHARAAVKKADHRRRAGHLRAPCQRRAGLLPRGGRNPVKTHG